jgi:hypothetical protein
MDSPIGRGQDVHLIRARDNRETAVGRVHVVDAIRKMMCLLAPVWLYSITTRDVGAWTNSLGNDVGVDAT